MSMIATRSALEYWHREFGAPKPPPELAYLESGFGNGISGHSERHVVTWADVMKARKERQANELHMKREFGAITRRAAYVWVFFVPGLIFGGWWVYLVGIEDVYHGGGYKEELAGELLNEVFRLFPLAVSDLFGSTDIEKWMAEFVKHYQRGFRGGKPQGKAPVWVEVEGSRVLRILGRAEWPKKTT